MIYKSNLSTVMTQLTIKLKGVADINPLLQEIAVSLAGVIPNRIHNDGIKSSGGKIGTYAPSTQISRRLSKKINTANRSKTTDIVLSFTGKLSKEFVATPTSQGWAVGMDTQYGTFLFEKFTERFGDIWSMTQEEQKAINRIVTKYINKQLK